LSAAVAAQLALFALIY